MSYSNWMASTRPKVQGTMNLHNALEHAPLDFFVMTSSLSGILGTPGQSNYAAANSFLDSLARHRLRRGQRASSLILSMVAGVGYVAEHIELEETIRRKGIYGIDEEHLLTSFEISIANQQSKESVDHIVLGLDPARLHKSVNETSATDAFWIENARFRALAVAIESGGSNSAAVPGKTILSAVKSAATLAAATKLVSDYFMEKLSRLLVVDSSDFEPEVKSIADYGLDSMIGTELGTGFSRSSAWIFHSNNCLGRHSL
jgi:KR domain